MRRSIMVQPSSSSHLHRPAAARFRHVNDHSPGGMTARADWPRSVRCSSSTSKRPGAAAYSAGAARRHSTPVCGVSPRRAWNSSTRRDLPMPGSPRSGRTDLSARSQRRIRPRRDTRQSSGPRRAASSSVDPTRSQDMTVMGRRPAEILGSLGGDRRDGALRPKRLRQLNRVHRPSGPLSKARYGSRADHR
jgi:hypothetical protein